jgi:diamine N-acetyltransferase
MIEGRLARLRAPEARDHEVLGALRNDVVVQRLLMARPRPNSAARVQGWLARVGDDPAAVLFVIADAATDEAAGFVQVIGIDLVDGVGSLGIAVAPAFQGHGLGREALALVERYVRDVFRLRKLVLQVLAGNEGAVALYRSAGWSAVGTHRAHFYAAGEYHDVLVMERFLPPAP